MDALAPRHRTLWTAAGMGLVGLAVVGVFVPVMPSTPFAIAAAACFARSSPELERRLLEHPQLGPPVVAWREKGAIPRGAKVVALSAMSVSGVGVALTAPPTAAMASGVVLVSAATWIATRPSA